MRHGLSDLLMGRALQKFLLDIDYICGLWVLCMCPVLLDISMTYVAGYYVAVLLDVGHGLSLSLSPVSYTHLTLPTRSLV